MDAAPGQWGTPKADVHMGWEQWGSVTPGHGAGDAPSPAPSSCAQALCAPSTKS